MSLESTCAATTVGRPTERTITQFPTTFPYRAFTAHDVHGRSVEFYLTDADAKDDRPLFIVLQGSGCASNFLLRDGRVGGGWHSFVRQASKNRAQILLVDKPGVALLDFPESPGDTTNCSQTFRREQRGDRWLTALSAAIDAVKHLRGNAPRALMAIGHSEGAVFAARLALLRSDVTHVASLGGAPMSQLHDFFDNAAAGEGILTKIPGDASQRIKYVLNAWSAVATDPASDDKKIFGHTHGYWADKFAPFEFDKLVNAKTKFFLAYGDRDENSAPRKMDVFAIELLVRKRDLTWLRVTGADHGFAQKGEPYGHGMRSMLEDAVAWFFAEPFDRKHIIWPTQSGG